MILLAIAAAVCFALLASYYWHQLFGEESSLGAAPFSRWLWAGLVVPSAAWLFLNSGWGLPPLIPRLARVQSAGGHWIWLFLSLPAPGLLSIATFWSAVTFAHLAVVIACSAESKREFAIIAAFWAVLVLPFVWFFTGGGLPWTGAALLFWLVPVAHSTISMANQPKAAPMYSRAVSRIKFGKYQEAEQEVLQQLEKRADDFEGWMMLAELYAKQFGDLAEADRTVRSVCEQPNITPLQVSLVCHRLADWHLQLADNPQGARRALEEICRRLPETHFAHMAQLRIQQLPASRQEWLEQKNPKAIRLPALGGDPDQAIPARQLTRSEALSLVEECVARLKNNPNDVPSREKFAEVLAENLGKVEVGIEQLQLLLGMKGQPERKRAEWLSQLAAWQFRFRHDRLAARQSLGVLIREYPQSVQAFAAQRWLRLLETEPAELSADAAHPAA